MVIDLEISVVYQSRLHLRRRSIGELFSGTVEIESSNCELANTLCSCCKEFQRIVKGFYCTTPSTSNVLIQSRNRCQCRLLHRGIFILIRHLRARSVFSSEQPPRNIWSCYKVP